MEFNFIALRKDKTLWRQSLTLLPSERTKLNGVYLYCPQEGQNSMEFISIALRKDKTLWSLSLLPSERTKLSGV